MTSAFRVVVCLLGTALMCGCQVSPDEYANDPYSSGAATDVEVAQGAASAVRAVAAADALAQGGSDAQALVRWMMGGGGMMGQAGQGAGGGFDVDSSLFGRTHCAGRQGNGRGFVMHGVDANGDPIGAGVDVVPQDDDTLLLMLHPGVLVVTRLEDGTIEVRNAARMVMCTVTVEESGDSFVVTMPTGEQITVTPTEGGSILLAFEDGTTQEVAFPDGSATT